MEKDCSKFWSVPKEEPVGSYAIVFAVTDSPMSVGEIAGRNRKIEEDSFWMYEGYRPDTDDWN